MKSSTGKETAQAESDLGRSQPPPQADRSGEGQQGGVPGFLLGLQRTHGNRFVQRLVQRNNDDNGGKPADPDTLGPAFVKKSSEVEALGLKKGTVKARVEGMPYVLYSPHSSAGSAPLRGLVEGSSVYLIRAGEIYQQVWAQQEGKPADSLYWGWINPKLVEYAAPTTTPKDNSPAVGQVLSTGKAASTQGDPQSDPRYIQKATLSVGIPIPGGPFYLKKSANPGWSDALVVPRSYVDLYNDPLKAKSPQVALTIVYKSREEADQAVTASAIPGAYTFYEGPDNVIFPTVISDTTAPVLCDRLRAEIRNEGDYAAAAGKTTVELFLWAVGLRYPIRAVDSAEALSASKAIPKAAVTPANIVSLLEQLKAILGADFAELEAAAKVLKATKPELASMSLEEIIAVRAYTKHFAYAFNRAMRLKDVVEVEKWRPLINLIRAGLDKLPRYQGIVRRGVSTTLSAMPEYKTGATVVHEAFTSSTIGQVSAQHRGFVEFIIECANGRSIQLVASTQEGEVLFLPGTKFLVTKVMDWGEVLGQTLDAGQIFLKEIL